MEGDSMEEVYAGGRINIKSRRSVEKEKMRYN